MATSETTVTSVDKIPDEEKKVTGVKPQYFGHKVITLDAEEVTGENVTSLLNTALATHTYNRLQIQYLWDYYKGRQPIMGKEKDYREDINNKIVVNRAFEIVSFFSGFLYSAPIAYAARKGAEGVSNAIEAINDMMSAENKERKDFELITWLLVAGTSYRYLMSKEATDEFDNAPFEIETLDPRDTFVAYSNRPGHKQLLSCTYWNDDNGDPTYGVYTDKIYYEIKGGNIISSAPHYHGRNPIVEFPANFARLGIFEPVLPLIDAGNQIESDRLDGLEQYIKGFVKFINCELEEGDLEEFFRQGAIMVSGHEGKGTPDVGFVNTEVSQTDTQTQADSIYNMILTICGMPNRNGGSSTSDTGSAVIFRDGWESASSRALSIENMFKGAEIETLKLCLRILKEKNFSGYDEQTVKDIKALRLRDIDVHFGRRNYANAMSKVQVLCQMLAEPKIHPRYAFEISDLFTDPENAYMQSMENYDKLLESYDPTKVSEEDLAKEDDDV